MPAGVGLTLWLFRFADPCRKSRHQEISTMVVNRAQPFMYPNNPRANSRSASGDGSSLFIASNSFCAPRLICANQRTPSLGRLFLYCCIICKYFPSTFRSTSTVRTLTVRIYDCSFGTPHCVRSVMGHISLIRLH